jgi:predicted nucleotidyltransferase
MLEESRTRIIDRVIEKLGRTIGIEAVILFGSWTRGGGGDWSDIDLLVVSNQVKHTNILDRFRLAAELREPRTDIFIYMYEEVESMLIRMNLLIVSALVEGTPIRTSERVINLIEYARRKFTKKGRLWVMEHSPLLL